jgi:hypothetical protein
VRHVFAAADGEDHVWNAVAGSVHAIRGRVRDGDGAAAAGARVRAVPEGFSWDAVKDLEQAAVADAEGRFELALPSAAPHLLTVHAPSAGAVRSPFPSLVRHDVRPDLEPLELALAAAAEPSARLEGRVLRRDGSPADGVVVSVWRERLPTSGGTMTAADGAFALGPLPPADCHVALRSDEAGIEYIGRIALGAGATVNLGTRVLAEPGRVLVRLRRSDGAAVRAPDVCELFTEPYGWSLAGFAAVAGGGARLELRSAPLAPGTHRLRLRGEDFVPVDLPVAVAAGRTTPLDLVLQAAARCVLRLHGEVRRGLPWHVRVEVTGDAVSWRRDLELDETGRAEVALGLGPGQYAATARSPLGTGATAVLHVPPPDGLDHRVELNLR